MISCGAPLIGATARSRSRSSVMSKLVSWALAVIREVERLVDEGIEIELAALADTPRECSSMLLTIPSARLPCSAIFSRLPVNISTTSSSSSRLSSPSAAGRPRRLP